LRLVANTPATVAPKKCPNSAKFQQAIKWLVTSLSKADV